MRIPGFTAEASLYRASERVYLQQATKEVIEGNRIVPQLTCSCDSVGGRQRCYCCHLNFRTQIMYCWIEDAIIA